MKRAPIVAIGKYVNNRAGVRPPDRLVQFKAAKQVRGLAQVRDEHKRAHLAKQLLQRIGKLQHKARHLSHRIRDVAQHHQPWLLDATPPQPQSKRQALRRHRFPQRAPHVEPTPTLLFWTQRRHRAQLLRQPLDLALQLVQLLNRHPRKRLFRQQLAPHLVRVVQVPLLKLGLYVAANGGA